MHSSSRSIVTLDIPSLHTVNMCLNDACEMIASAIVDWNVNMAYAKSMQEANQGNCQDFCNDILARFGLKHSWKMDDALGKFFIKMQELGESELIYEPSYEMREKLHLDEHYLFTSHVDLDALVNKLVTHPVHNLEIRQSSDWLLLKNFDRAFWLKFLANDAMGVPLEYRDVEQCACPFLDPRGTIK